VQIQRGVYFLANDRTFEVAVAFLTSLRTSNPLIPLCLIPFGGSCRKIWKLRDKYGFSIYSNHARLAACDALSTHFHKDVVGHYRKLCIWDGPFEEFVYIDVDTVVLQKINFVYELLSEYDVITGHSNLAGSRRYVWKDSIYKSSELSTEEIAYSANTGFIASKRGIVTERHISETLPHALRLRPHMALECMEQPYLNVIIMAATGRYSSIHEINNRIPSLRLPHESWAGDLNWRLHPSGKCEYNGHPTEVLFVHWAGIWSPIGIERFTNTLLAIFGLCRRGLRRKLAQRSLWLHFRRLDVNKAAGTVRQCGVSSSAVASTQSSHN